MAICRVAKRGFYSFANKNICDEREEVKRKIFLLNIAQITFLLAK